MRVIAGSTFKFVLRTPLWLVAVVYIPMALIVSFSAEHLMFGASSGVLLFSLIEYVTHRWIFHYFENSNPALFDKLHGAHHRRPGDRRRRAVPLVFSLIYAVPFVGVAFFGTFGAAVSTGMIIGYVLFEFLHASAHSQWAKRSNVPYIRNLVRRHALHHHHDSSSEFAITIPLWDRIFLSKLPRRAHSSAADIHFVPFLRS